jgi:hypothetical protein
MRGKPNVIWRKNDLFPPNNFRNNSPRCALQPPQVLRLLQKVACRSGVRGDSVGLGWRTHKEIWEGCMVFEEKLYPVG